MDDAPKPHEVVTKTATDARQGVTLGVMRWVLVISLASAALALVVVYLLT